MLRLLYSGLNMDDDAQIYIRNAVFETLFSFYVSPTSDHESKELIVQVIKVLYCVVSFSSFWSFCVLLRFPSFRGCLLMVNVFSILVILYLTEEFDYQITMSHVFLWFLSF